MTSSTSDETTQSPFYGLYMGDIIPLVGTMSRRAESANAVSLGDLGMDGRNEKGARDGDGARSEKGEDRTSQKSSHNDSETVVFKCYSNTEKMRDDWRTGSTSQAGSDGIENRSSRGYLDATSTCSAQFDGRFEMKRI
ncbi:hypothetical protein EYC84_006250 [Monilinia fructicola]|uniref:Uncharacterized protein n=1 Tax=Monilinia fructicola TaxID=38448 RepID=A0A5M9K2R6_MONFR|nr:hypothetical protein EYC84_006250 [Monilinia fructicola]